MQAPCNSSNNSSMAGIGNLSGMVALSNARSTQNRQLPSFFLTNKTELENGLTLG
ncbi:LOW QUALITY PROTEIN: hypothetical protein TorRG33x02_296680 [Trema orientale]|uniref:Uncharacterized protein n=1 Tax=Trema orientale TaxID=63057 RepID=A0A2P5C5H2_TREOI|nr:LOW QUALITY PROTEIN: hypothetical protein TorRG33x02_296680 [Trema orientale]